MQQALANTLTKLQANYIPIEDTVSLPIERSSLTVPHVDKFNGKITVLYILIRGHFLLEPIQQLTYFVLLIHYSMYQWRAYCMYACTATGKSHTNWGHCVNAYRKVISTTWINAMEILQTKWGHVMLEPNNNILCSVPGDWELMYECTFMISYSMNHVISYKYVWHVMSHVVANLTYFETKLLQLKCTKCEHSMVVPRKHIVNLLYSWTTDKWRNKCMQWWNHERMDVSHTNCRWMLCIKP